MAEQHWVKYYRIKPENIHDDGTIDSDWIDFGGNHKKYIYDDFMK